MTNKDKMKKHWMQCTTCKYTVIQNEVGICLACQTGSKRPGEDSYVYYQLNEIIKQKNQETDAS